MIPERAAMGHKCSCCWKWCFAAQIDVYFVPFFNFYNRPTFGLHLFCLVLLDASIPTTPMSISEHFAFEDVDFGAFRMGSSFEDQACDTIHNMY